MSTSHILSLLLEERDRLQAAINALHDAPASAPDNVPDWVKPAPKKKRTLSAAGRSAIREGLRRRWAAIRATKAESAAPKKKTTKAIIAEAIAPKEDTDFKNKMSAAMKASWAKRRKKTAKIKGAK